MIDISYGHPFLFLIAFCIVFTIILTSFIRGIAEDIRKANSLIQQFNRTEYYR